MDEVLGREKLQYLLENHALKPPPGEEYESYEIDRITFFKNIYPASTIHAMKFWQARTDDVFVISYPKAGTTWTQEIVSVICHNEDLDAIKNRHTMFRVPFLESSLFNQEANVSPTYELVGKMQSPRTIKTHLPGSLLPPDILTKKSRIVYVIRNPKDAAVSLFKFYSSNPRLPTPSSWVDFFHDYMEGKTLFGPWWSHVLYYWNLRHLPHVLIIRFEEMKKDHRRTVETIAQFLGYKLSNDVIEQIVSHTSFDNMKANPMTNPDTLPFYRKSETASFMRKGCVGDWKQYFTEQQSEAMDAFVEKTFAESGLDFAM